MPMKNPPHPGEFIRTELIGPAGLSVTAAAAALQVSRPALSSLLTTLRKPASARRTSACTGFLTLLFIHRSPLQCSIKGKL